MNLLMDISAFKSKKEPIISAVKTGISAVKLELVQLGRVVYPRPV
jgi:hypothetical protein